MTQTTTTIPTTANPNGHADRFLSINDLSPELRGIAEQVKSERSYEHFIVEHGVVEIREVGLKPFKEVMWPFQLSFVRLIDQLPRVVVVKARQIGISTILMHYAYWRIRFGKPHSEHVLVLSKSKDDASKVLMAKVPQIHAALPPELRMPIVSQNSYFFQLANGNSITVLAATEAGGRGHAATVVILDEHAFHQSAESNWAALQPTLEGAGKFFVVSTGNGIGNLFHDIYTKAKDGQNSFTPVFINWSAPSHRDEEWLEKQKRDSAVAEELFKQEYPETDDEAFAKTGNSPFDLEHVVTMIRRSQAHLGTKVYHDGRTRIWAEPMPGRRYAAGLDLAQGLTAKGIPDSSSLKIVDEQSVQVAAWDGKVELDTAAGAEMVELLNKYHAVLGIERNGPGSGVIGMLQALGFDNFYRWDESHLYPDAKPTREPTIGIQRTQALKARQVQMLAAYVNTRSLQSYDEVFWKQCATFVQIAPMRWGPQGKNKDDSVDAMTHALWVLEHMPRKFVRRKARKFKWR